MTIPAPVENGGTESDMVTEEETWEQKDEPDGGGGGEEEEGGEKEEEGAACGQGGPSDEEVQRLELGDEDEEDDDDEMMMEEEEEELPLPKVAPAQPNAPKKEHVNVVFIGHVGASSMLRDTLFVFFSSLLRIGYLGAYVGSPNRFR